MFYRWSSLLHTSSDYIANIPFIVLLKDFIHGNNLCNQLHISLIVHYLKNVKLL
jgi:hypothetical protein